MCLPTTFEGAFETHIFIDTHQFHTPLPHTTFPRLTRYAYPCHTHPDNRR